MHLARKAEVGALDGCDQVEAEQGQVGQVVRAEGLAVEVGVDQAQAAQAAAPGPVAPQARDGDLSGVPDVDLLNPAAAVEQHPDLSSDLTRDLRKAAGQLGGDDLVLLDASLVKLGQAGFFAWLESEQVAFEVLDRQSGGQPEVLGIEALQLGENEAAVLADQHVVEVDLAARLLTQHHVPMNLGAIAVLGNLVALAQSQVQ